MMIQMGMAKTYQKKMGMAKTLELKNKIKNTWIKLLD
jgi:hypothetical protein